MGNIVGMMKKLLANKFSTAGMSCCDSIGNVLVIRLRPGQVTGGRLLMSGAMGSGEHDRASLNEQTRWRSNDANL